MGLCTQKWFLTIIKMLRDLLYCISNLLDNGLNWKVLVFCRVLVIFSVINMLNYLDRGAIASNGVNGSRRTCTKSGTCSAGSGIQ